MRILVYPHDLNMGGSQLNAIQIAARIHRMGHQTVIYGRPGTLNKTISDYGLEFIESPAPSHRPTPSIIRHLRRVIDEHEIDIVHGYEWPPALEAYLAAKGKPTVALGTVLSMSVAPFIPRTMPLIVGTEQIAAYERLCGRKNVHVIEPPVDLDWDDMELIPGGREEFRQEYAIPADAVLTVMVTRLARELKLEGILSAIRTIASMGSGPLLHLALVGDGPAREDVQREVDRANSTRREPVVTLTGELVDPRPAYAAADIVLGMGSSALRGMAYAKPIIIQGERGFWKTLTQDTLDQFLWTGWYGAGGAGDGDLQDLLAELAADERTRTRQGQYALSVVTEHSSLDAIGLRMRTIYDDVVARQEFRTIAALADLRSLLSLTRYQLGRNVSRMRRSKPQDDFNSRPVARLHQSGEGNHVPGALPLVWFAGVTWEQVDGTEKHLVQEMAKYRRVIWVDPPVPHRRPWWSSSSYSISPNIHRLMINSPRGVTKPGIRAIGRWYSGRAADMALRAWGQPEVVVMVASPNQGFPKLRSAAVAKCYFETDDFVAGAEMFGCTPRYMRRRRRRNVDAADGFVAVSAVIHRSVEGHCRSRLVLPNGCEPAMAGRVQAARADLTITIPRPIVGMVGQINDRVDIDLLEAIAEADISLLLVGPRHPSSEENRLRLDGLLERPKVQWLDRVERHRLPEIYAAMSVGLTPYVENAFNLSSAPLKTLEYLAAGLPVVSTDLPSARALGQDHVRVGSGPAAYLAVVRETLVEVEPSDRRARRLELAEALSWERQGRELQAFLEGLACGDRARRSR